MSQPSSCATIDDNVSDTISKVKFAIDILRMTVMITVMLILIFKRSNVIAILLATTYTLAYLVKVFNFSATFTGWKQSWIVSDCSS